MSVKKIALASAIAAATVTTSAFAVDMHGYGRVGNGWSADGGQHDCGHSVQRVGRLGNECDFFAEVVLAQNLYEKEQDSGDVSFDFTTRFALANSQVSNDWEAITPSWREYYVSATGVVGSSTLWMGKRFYKRQDIHITDDYVVASDGPGFGIENIAAGPGNLHLAWMMSYGDNGGINVQANTIDVRYDGLQINPNGFLDLQARVGFSIVPSNEDTTANKTAIDNMKTGFELAAFHTQSGLLGGFNRVGIQYGTEGMARNAGNSLKHWNTVTDGDSRIRIFDTFVFETGNISQMFVASFIMTDNDSNSGSTLLNFAWRPQFHLNEYNAVAFEVGYFVETADDKNVTSYTYADGSVEDSRSGYKLTASYNVRAGKSFWARPEMRFFVSYNGGDEAINASTDGTGSDLADVITLGWQTELWF